MRRIVIEFQGPPFRVFFFCWRFFRSELLDLLIICMNGSQKWWSLQVVCHWGNDVKEEPPLIFRIGDPKFFKNELARVHQWRTPSARKGPVQTRKKFSSSSSSSLRRNYCPLCVTHHLPSRSSLRHGGYSITHLWCPFLKCCSWPGSFHPRKKKENLRLL